LQIFRKYFANTIISYVEEKKYLVIRQTIDETNDKRILGRAKEFPLSNNKIHHADPGIQKRIQAQEARKERRGEGVGRAEPSTGQSARLQFFSLHT
jgi:hypothetical protein